MNNHIDFYFDVISPYAYIAFKKIIKKKIKCNYKPIFLGGLHNLAEIEAPAFNKYKMKNMKNDCDLVAKKNNIEFNWNSNFPINSLSIMRGYLHVDKLKKIDYLDCFFEAYWKDNLNLGNDEIFFKLLNNLNIDSDHFFKSIKEETVKDELKRVTKEAFEKEVFGAPTFIVNDKIFWGQDRLEYALEEFGSN